MVVHVAQAYAELATAGSADIYRAVALAYQRFPYTFIVGLLSLMLAVQLNGMAMLSLQNKRYFDELFHLGSTLLRQQREAEQDRRREEREEREIRREQRRVQRAALQALNLPQDDSTPQHASTRGRPIR
jgi:hypothetical protein